MHCSTELQQHISLPTLHSVSPGHSTAMTARWRAHRAHRQRQAKHAERQGETGRCTENGMWGVKREERIRKFGVWGGLKEEWMVK